jgi:hypothetical protein
VIVGPRQRAIGVRKCHEMNEITASFCSFPFLADLREEGIVVLREYWAMFSPMTRRAAIS